MYARHCITGLLGEVKFGKLGKSISNGESLNWQAKPLVE